MQNRQRQHAAHVSRLPMLLRLQQPLPCATAKQGEKQDKPTTRSLSLFKFRQFKNSPVENVRNQLLADAVGDPELQAPGGHHSRRAGTRDQEENCGAGRDYCCKGREKMHIIASKASKYSI